MYIFCQSVLVDNNLFKCYFCTLQIINYFYLFIIIVLLHVMYAFFVYHPVLLCELFYRLGHGDLIEEEGKSIPFRVEILHMHRYHTVSLSPLDWINYCGRICHIFNIKFLHLLMIILWCYLKQNLLGQIFCMVWFRLCKCCCWKFNLSHSLFTSFYPLGNLMVGLLRQTFTGLINSDFVTNSYGESWNSSWKNSWVPVKKKRLQNWKCLAFM